MRKLMILITFLLVGCDAPQPDNNSKGPSPLELMQKSVDAEQRSAKSKRAPDTRLKILENGEPNYVSVSHILIGFKGSIPEKPLLERSKEDAKKLAYELFERAKAGENFETLVDKYSEDKGSSRYRIANEGQADFTSRINREFNIIARKKLVDGFSDAAFKLDVGEYCVVDYHPDRSKYGWHVIKRTK